MASIGSTRTDSSVTIADGVTAVKNPLNTTITTSGIPSTETSFTLTAIKSVEIINRGSVVLHLAFSSGQSGTNYRTLYPNSPYQKTEIDAQTITFYIQAPSASQRVEVVSWS